MMDRQLSAAPSLPALASTYASGSEVGTAITGRAGQTWFGGREEFPHRLSWLALPLAHGGELVTTPAITVYGAFWCPDCHRSRQFLGEHQIPYRWIDIEEDSAGEQFVIDTNQGKRRIPTIVFGSGAVLSVPSNEELARELGLKTTAERHHYELIVVGGGPAGLTAALYSAREGIETLVIERAAFGGQAATTMQLDNVPGFPEGLRGSVFGENLRVQAERFGVEMLQAQDVVSLCTHDNYHCLETSDGSEYSARAVILATGSHYRRLGVPGEDEYIGAGVHFCATCDGPFYRGREVAVVGGGNSAAEESLFLTRFADRVTLLVRGKTLSASQVIAESVLSHDKIDVRFETVVEAFEGADSKLHTVHVRSTSTGASDVLPIPGAFVFIGLDPNTGFLSGSEIRLDPWGFIVTGHDLVHDGRRPPAFEDNEPAILETSVPGIFAAGDVRKDSTKQVASAAGEGAAVALMIRDYLRSAGRSKSTRSAARAPAAESVNRHRVSHGQYTGGTERPFMSLYIQHTEETAPGARESFERAKRAFGMTPNLVSTMAESPTVAKAYLDLHESFACSSFTPVEQQVVALSASFANGCEYCMAAESAVARMVRADEAVVEALRNGTPLPDARLNALAAFTKAVVRKRGRIGQTAINAFMDEGFSKAQVLEVILGVTKKTLSNYVNHIAEISVDPKFEPMAWTRPRPTLAGH